MNVCSIDPIESHGNDEVKAYSSRTFVHWFRLNNMPATVILGAQWGDEGKGKLVDRLAEQATWVARFQGGNNAGHTVVIGDRILKFHLLPSGITRQEAPLSLVTVW